MNETVIETQGRHPIEDPIHATRGRWPRGLIALLVARAVNQLGAFAMAFLAVTLVTVYDVDLSTAGMVVSLFGLATIPSRLMGGRLADRFGRRPTIIAGLLGCAVALAVIAASANVAGAGAGAVLLGLAFEIYEPASQALLAELIPSGQRTEAFGLLGVALATASVGSGALAAVLGGLSLRWLFVADATTCLAAAMLVAVIVRDPRTTPPTPHPEPSPWRDPRLLIMLGLGIGIALSWNLETNALPLTVRARGLEPALTGWILAVSALVTVAGQRLLRGDKGRRPHTLLACGLVLEGLGFAVLAGSASLPALMVGRAIVALGQVFLLGPPYALVAGLCSDGSRAQYLAAFGTCWGVAQTLGPILATRLLAQGVTTVWLTGAGLCLALAALQPLAARHTQSAAPGPR